MQLYFSEGGEPENSAAHRGGIWVVKDVGLPAVGMQKVYAQEKRTCALLLLSASVRRFSVTFRPDDCYTPLEA